MGATLADAGYKFSVVETHHVSKKDAPSGTAISIAEMVERGAGAKIPVPIESMREGDAKGTHVLEAVSEADKHCADARGLLPPRLRGGCGARRGMARGKDWLLRLPRCVG